MKIILTGSPRVDALIVRAAVSSDGMRRRCLLRWAAAVVALRAARATLRQWHGRIRRRVERLYHSPHFRRGGRGRLASHPAQKARNLNGGVH